MLALYRATIFHPIEKVPSSPSNHALEKVLSSPSNHALEKVLPSPSNHALEKVLPSPSPSGRGVGVRANEPFATVPAKPNRFAVKRRYSRNEPPDSLFGSGNGRF